MNIIIVGGGKVGKALTEQLNEEGNSITIIDIVPEKVEYISNRYDVMGIVGNGATHEIQQQAGIVTADLLIAVTASDELNLLCCLIAKKAGNCKTIARVRNPEYNSEVEYFKEMLGIAMLINPEYASATEISRVLRFPSAIKIDTFAKGKIELLKFRLLENSPLIHHSVKEIATDFHCDVLVCTIERDRQAFIANGNFIFEKDDIISIIATPKNASYFFKKIKIKTQQVNNAMIIGGGSIAYYLSKILLKSGISVKIIEKNEKRCEELSILLPEATIIHGDASDQEILMEEGLEKAGAFVALTNMDEENILFSLFAKSKMSGKLVTKINRTDFDEVIQSMNLDSIVNPKSLTAEYIALFVRAMKNSMGSNMETLYTIIKGKVEASEFKIRTNSRIAGVPLEQLKLKDNVLIAGIMRENNMIIPRGHDKIEIGDSVIVVSTHLGLHDICDILE
ncbi:MAG: Trk system potassium transporter TrkA [Ruminococcus sp.]|nr:Trk system potassium transporter TrkA [Ruminococcus sp.]